MEKDVTVTAAVLRACAGKLMEENKGAHKLLLDSANESFFEQHQTPGALKKLATALLGTTEAGKDK